MKSRLKQSRANSRLIHLYDDSAVLDIIGLNSGTSGDGLDAALVRFQPHKPPQILFAKTYPYPAELSARIIDAAEYRFNNGIKWLELDTELGIFMGKLTAKFIFEVKGIKAKPGLIASHGQTIRHLPSRQMKTLTLQIGEPSYIAQVTGMPVISDFRRSDLAAGGEGAPLSPVLHQALFSHRTKWRAIVNIGGIANITIMPPQKSKSHPLAADCGPGNMLIDMAMKKLFGKSFDHNGRTALHGNADFKIVSQILRHPFFAKRPPKSTGRELFGEDFLSRILKSTRNKSNEDIIATISEITILGISEFISRFGKNVVEIYLCGGGAKNKYIISRLVDLHPDKIVATTAELGYDPDYLESLLWAFLAWKFVREDPIDTRYFTGAKMPYIPGKLCLP